MQTRRSTRIPAAETSAQAEIRGRQLVIQEEEEDQSEEHLEIESNPPIINTVNHDARALILEDYQPVDPNHSILPVIGAPTLATARVTAFPRKVAGKYKVVFLRVNKQAIWDHIAEKTTQNMKSKVAGGISEQNARKYFNKPVTGTELQVILGLEIIFRGRRNITSYEEQFLVLPAELEEWPIAAKRMKAILGSLDADFGVLANHLRKSWASVINPGEECSVDEAIFDFFSQTDLSSPQRFMPRKPHPHGLLCFYGGFKTAKGPFMFDLEPDFQVNSLNSRLALERIMARWEWDLNPHAIFDAGFSGEEALKTLGNLGVLFTASVNIAHKRGLYRVLHAHCDPKRWIAVTDKAGLVWSLLRGDTAAKEQFLVTSAFQTTRLPKRRKIITEEQEESLAGVGREGLLVIGAELGIEPLSTAKDLAQAISASINSRAPYGAAVPEQAVRGSARESREHTVGAHVFSEEDLRSKRRGDLASIAKGLGVKVGAKKRVELLEAILNAQKVTEPDMKEFEAKLRAAQRPHPSPQHVKYHDHFNAIDIHDRRWNYLQNHHVIKDWRAKFIMSLLQTGVVNSWTIQRSFEDISFQNYLNRLSVQLCEL